nr:MFS transporter [Candidatus Pantoea persica]
MTTACTSGMAPGYAAPTPENSLAGRINALLSSPGLWRFIALGGFFELYDLFETGYISSRLLAAGVFHTGSAGAFGIADQAIFASATFLGLFVGASLLAHWADRFGRRLTFMYALV